MREIKFRAWNQDAQEFQYMILTTGGHWSHNIEAYSTNAVKDWSQYTGLKDKNGVEIYEGDIVKFHDDWGRYYYVDTVTKNDDAMPIGTVRITTYKGVTCKFPPKRFTQFWEDHMTSGERPLKGEWNLSDSTRKWEIIGNIYENPELLSSTQATPTSEGVEG